MFYVIRQGHCVLKPDGTFGEDLGQAQLFGHAEALIAAMKVGESSSEDVEVSLVQWEPLDIAHRWARKPIPHKKRPADRDA